MQTIPKDIVNVRKDLNLSVINPQRLYESIIYLYLYIGRQNFELDFETHHLIGIIYYIYRCADWILCKYFAQKLVVPLEMLIRKVCTTASGTIHYRGMCFLSSVNFNWSEALLLFTTIILYIMPLESSKSLNSISIHRRRCRLAIECEGVMNVQQIYSTRIRWYAFEKPNQKSKLTTRAFNARTVHGDNNADNIAHKQIHCFPSPICLIELIFHS